MRRRCARSLAWRTVFRIPPSRGRGVGYGGLFPFYGTHPHFLLMENWQFALWPLLSHARRWAADHWYALWPLATWACYDEDRDTSGAGYSWMFWPCYGTALGGQQLYMLDCWLWDLRYEEDKIAGNTRDRGEQQGRARVGAGHFEPALAVQSLLKSADRAGLHRADPIQEAQVAVATLPASAQGKGCPGMNTTYTVKHIQKGLTLFTHANRSAMGSRILAGI